MRRIRFFINVLKPGIFLDAMFLMQLFLLIARLYGCHANFKEWLLLEGG